MTANKKETQNAGNFESDFDMEVEESIMVPSGTHKGIISDVKIKDVVGKTGEQYKYVDYYITLSDFVTKDNRPVSLKTGYNKNLATKSKLFDFLKRLNPNIKLGDELNIKEIAINKKVIFDVATARTQRGEFSNIVQDSIKLA